MRAAVQDHDMTPSIPADLIEVFVHDAFPGVRKAGPAHWIAGGEESISYEPHLHGENKVFEEESFWFRQRNQVFLELLSRFAAEPPLLDVGGGTGIVGKFLTENGFPAVNIEPTPSGAAYSLARAVPTIVSTLQRSGVRRNSIGAIGMFDVLEHIEDDGSALAIASAALKPGGHMIVAVPAHSWLWSLEDRIAGHYRRYNRRSLSATLEGAGLETIYVTHIFSYLTAPLLMLRSLPTLWGRIGQESKENKRKIHVPRQWVGRLVRQMGNLERSRIERGKTIPFGTSVVAVARKPVHDAG